MNTSPRRTFSVEFFPPKTDEGAAKLRAVRAELAPSSTLRSSR